MGACKNRRDGSHRWGDRAGGVVRDGGVVFGFVGGCHYDDRPRRRSPVETTTTTTVAAQPRRCADHDDVAATTTTLSPEQQADADLRAAVAGLEAAFFACSHGPTEAATGCESRSLCQLGEKLENLGHND